MLLLYICTKFVPIINSIGFNNHDGEFYNINADTLAYFIASSLKAPIYVLSNIAGVLINDVVIPQLPLVDINQYIEHGDIYGGMIPKVLDAKMLLKMAVLKLSLHQETSQISLKLFIIMILLDNNPNS